MTMFLSDPAGMVRPERKPGEPVSGIDVSAGCESEAAPADVAELSAEEGGRE